MTTTEWKTQTTSTFILSRQGFGTKIHINTCAVSYGGRNTPKVTIVATVVIPAGSTVAEIRALIAEELNACNISTDRLCTKCNYYK